MTRLLAAVLSIALALPGCAASRAPMAVQPAGPAGASAARPVDPAFARYVRALPAGARVKVVEREGPRYAAILLGVEGDAIVLQRATRVPEPTRRVPMAAVASVARDERGGVSAGKAVVIGIAAGAATFFGLLFAAFALVSD
jgi:hypothetical protein